MLLSCLEKQVVPSNYLLPQLYLCISHINIKQDFLSFIMHFFPAAIHRIKMFFYICTPYIIIPSFSLSRCYMPVVAPVMSDWTNSTCKSEHSHCGCDLIFSSTEIRQTQTAANEIQQVCPSQVKLFGCNSLAKSIGFIFPRGFNSPL